jgi:hypothetical protein
MEQQYQQHVKKVCSYVISKHLYQLPFSNMCELLMRIEKMKLRIRTHRCKDGSKDLAEQMRTQIKKKNTKIDRCVHRPTCADVL